MLMCKVVPTFEEPLDVNVSTMLTDGVDDINEEEEDDPTARAMQFDDQLMMMMMISSIILMITI
ncbi:hypothetical protein HAX54_031073, partial [Datura stramonium]|nr:hypothetical protein [Datura stramonium]